MKAVSPVAAAVSAVSLAATAQEDSAAAILSPASPATVALGASAVAIHSVVFRVVVTPGASPVVVTAAEVTDSHQAQSQRGPSGPLFLARYVPLGFRRKDDPF